MADSSRWTRRKRTARKARGFLPRQAPEGFLVLLARRARDLIGHRGGRGLAREADGVEPVAHVLLVEAFRALALAPGIERPEARRVRRERLVDEGQRAGRVHPELELGVRDDDAARERVVGGGAVELERRLAHGSRALRADGGLGAREVDVLVMLAGLGLGSR